MDKFKTIDLSKSGWNFRLTICPKGTLVKVEMKEFNQKDDKYKEVKTSWSGKTLTINDIEDVLDDAIKASRPDGMKPARGKGKFFDDLNTIKEQLFDAPEDVKKSFNTLVQYFAQNEPTDPGYIDAKNKVKLYSELLVFTKKNADKIEELLKATGAYTEGSTIYERGYALGKSKVFANTESLIKTLEENLNHYKEVMNNYMKSYKRKLEVKKFQQGWLDKILKKFKFDPSKVGIDEYTDKIAKGEYYGFKENPQKSLDYININNRTRNENPFESVTGDLTDFIKEASRKDHGDTKFLSDNLVVRCNSYGWLTLYIPVDQLTKK